MHRSVRAAVSRFRPAALPRTSSQRAGPLLVRCLAHPEDGSVTWFIGKPDVLVIDSASTVHAVLARCGASAASLVFSPAELRADFEREFGLLA